MKPTQVSIFKLNGNKKAIKEYAKLICGMPTNAYVMALNKENEIVWCFQGSNEEHEVDEDVTWEDVARVEIYDHTLLCPNEEVTKFEQVYVNSQKALNGYIEEAKRAESEYNETYEVVNNTTNYKFA